MPDEERSTGEILADFYSGRPISDDDKAKLREKAAERVDAFDSKMYQHIARSRARQPGVLFKSGAAALLHPLQDVGGVKLRDSESSSPSDDQEAFEYHYLQRIALHFDAVSNQAVGESQSYTVELYDGSLPGGIRANNDFVSEYEGFIEIAQDKNRAFALTWVVTHHFSDGTMIVAKREFRERLIRNQYLTIPLNVYNSRSQVRLGSYTDGSGNTITITESMLDQATRLVIELDIEIQGTPVSWNLIALDCDLCEANFWQL